MSETNPMQADTSFELLIDGAGVAGERHFDVINPATEEVVGRAPDCTRSQLDAAVAAARKAFSDWKATPIGERQAKVAAIGDMIAAHIDDLSRLLTSEQGKPVARAAVSRRSSRRR